jgi:hypothetical protein
MTWLGIADVWVLGFIIPAGLSSLGIAVIISISGLLVCHVSAVTCRGASLEPACSLGTLLARARQASSKPKWLPYSVCCKTTSEGATSLRLTKPMIWLVTLLVSGWSRGCIGCLMAWLLFRWVGAGCGSGLYLVWCSSWSRSGVGQGFLSALRGWPDVLLSVRSPIR